ncbi:MAG: hypothetical protein AB4206_20960 [Xenococcaceae cyanobacterium]
MKKITLLGLVAILAIAVESCSFLSQFSALDNQEAKTPTSSTANTTNNLAENENQPEKSAEASNIPPSPRISGLIPATNPDIRVSGSIRGRQDPFALVNIQPQIEKVETDEISRNSEPRPPRSRRDKNDSKGITGVPTIDSLGDRAKNSELLPLLADRVIITGIVKLDGITKIIVKAPEESYTRHVGVGEYLSNGQILVKGVEGVNSATPKVVLEQKGQEIKKGVGEQPTTEEDPESEFTAQGINKLPSKTLNNSHNWLPNFWSQKLKDIDQLPRLKYAGFEAQTRVATWG